MCYELFHFLDRKYEGSIQMGNFLKERDSQSAEWVHYGIGGLRRLFGSPSSNLEKWLGKTLKNYSKIRFAG